jgi:hypothetical protein
MSPSHHPSLSLYHDLFGTSQSHSHSGESASGVVLSGGPQPISHRALLLLFSLIYGCGCFDLAALNNFHSFYVNMFVVFAAALVADVLPWRWVLEGSVYS